MQRRHETHAQDRTLNTRRSANHHDGTTAEVDQLYYCDFELVRPRCAKWAALTTTRTQPKKRGHTRKFQETRSNTRRRQKRKGGWGGVPTRMLEGILKPAGTKRQAPRHSHTGKSRIGKPPGTTQNQRQKQQPTNLNKPFITRRLLTGAHHRHAAHARKKTNFAVHKARCSFSSTDKASPSARAASAAAHTDNDRAAVANQRDAAHAVAQRHQ